MCLRSTPASPAGDQFRLIGNALHILHIICVVLYGVAILQFTRATSDTHQRHQPWLTFDSEWLHYGFCMPHEEVPLLSTHERSGFFMIFISTLGFVVVQLLNDSSGKMDNAKERVNWALVGALGHAMGHIILVTAKRYGLLPSGEVSALDEFLADDCTIGTYAKHIPGYILFWIPLVKTYMYNVSRNHVAVFAFLVLMGGFPIPLKYGFSYTLTVLFIGQSLDQLFLPKQRKGFEYMLWPVVTLLPNFCLYVLESQLCTESALFKKHGHIIFDGYMGLSYSVYYLICWWWNSNKVKSEKRL